MWINPEFVWKSDQTATWEEGCLSVPEFYAEVERPAAVKRGATIQVELRGAGLRITLRGRVLETGAIGAPIKVINERSGRVFSARLESPTLAVVEVGR